MAGIKISNLPASTGALLTDLFPVVQAGVTNKETLSQIATLLNSVLTFLPTGGGTLTGPLILSGDATNNLGAVTLEQLNTVASGITVQGAARLGTTANLTAAYSNGTAGVGATLTNSGTQAALTIDSVAAAVNDRILVKNQSSNVQNGIYTVTNIGSGSTNWVLTRATDYNMPSQINPGDLVVVTAGTTQTSSSWLMSSPQVTTIGTSPITFVIFFSPSSYLQVANNLSDVASVATSLTNLGVTSVGTAAVGQVPGVITNSNASAGNVGEYLSTIVLLGAAVPLTSATGKTIATLSLTAGDWDIWGEVWLTGGGTTVVSIVQCSIFTTLNTVTTVPTDFSAANYFYGSTSALAGVGPPTFPVGPTRMALSATTPVYLNVLANFATSTLSGYGKICARRRR